MDSHPRRLAAISRNTLRLAQAGLLALTASAVCAGSAAANHNDALETIERLNAPNTALGTSHVRNHTSTGHTFDNPGEPDQCTAGSTVNYGATVWYEFHPHVNGRYRVVVTPAGGRPVQIGGFVLRGHAYPVRGPHGFRGAIGRFGAPRSGGRTHEGFDVNAACGTPVVAARAGTVRVSDYDPVLYGHRVIVRARGERRGYWFTHLRSPSPLRAGDRVATGGRIGRIGATGNAVTVGCHLHFELRGRGGPLDPEPELRLWDRWS